MELEVWWSGKNPRLVGSLHQSERGRIHFEYDGKWRAGGLELSPFHLPNSMSGAVVNPASDYGELHGLFQDALPDWWGERLMRMYFERAGVPWGRVTALRKLSCQGERKMGALSFLPAIDGGDFNDALVAELGELVEAAREVMRGETAEVLTALLKGGMSPGGVQAKALLSISDDFSEIRLDDPAREGFGAWLIKFDMEPGLELGRVEAAYAKMASVAGVDVPETRLLEAGDACHFLSRRFDRTADGERLHLHSFSGLTQTPLRDGLDYSDLIEVARFLTRDQSAVDEIFRRAAFNILAGNDDDHGKNHGFVMDGEGKWKLAPAYDLTLASNPLGSGFRAARVGGRSMGITMKDLVKLAEECDVTRPKAILAQVAEAVADWKRYGAEQGISAANMDFVAVSHRVSEVMG